jgi:hypothetical protein
VTRDTKHVLLLFAYLITLLIFQSVEGLIMNSFMNSELEGTWKEMNLNKPDIYLQRLRKIKDMFRKF